jgi:acyl carrier protein
MSKEEIKKIIFSLLPGADINSSLIGGDSILDSLGLVSFIVDLEAELFNKGLHITIVTDKAMSLSSSPFRTINTLIDFIYNEHTDNRNK